MNPSPTSSFVPRPLAKGGRVYFKAMTTAYIAGLLLAFGANAVTGEGQVGSRAGVCREGKRVGIGLRRALHARAPCWRSLCAALRRFHPSKPCLQPALVYIVPCMLGTLVFLGLKRREMWRLWRYTDTTPERPGKKEDAEQQQQAAEDKQQG